MTQQTSYKAYKDAELLTKLEDLNTAYIHIDGVDYFGHIEITITSCEDAEDTINATINAEGLLTGETPRMRGFAMNASTLRQLLSMSAAYAAGYAAARQFYDDKDRPF